MTAATQPLLAPRIAAFISIPRNASHTVREVLELGPNRDFETTASPVIHENHQRGAVLAARYDLEPLFVFCFVRHPYLRCLSWFRFHRDVEPYRRFSFEQWVAAGMPHHWGRQNQTDYAASGATPLLQTTFVAGCRVDFVGRFETFDRDLRHVVAALNSRAEAAGLAARYRYRQVRLNSTVPWPPPERLLTAPVRKTIQHLLAADFERFGFPVDTVVG